MVAGRIHPLVFAVTVYVCEDAPLKVVLAPVLEVRPVVGAHVNVLAGSVLDMFMLAVKPWHIFIGLGGVKVSVGGAFTVTVTYPSTGPHPGDVPVTV